VIDVAHKKRGSAVWKEDGRMDSHIIKSNEFDAQKPFKIDHAK